MIELTLYNRLAIENGNQIPVYKFKSPYKINILMGDSGSGKSLFFSCVEEALRNTAGWTYKCSKDIQTVSNISELENSISTREDVLFIMDEDILQVLLKRKMADRMLKSKNYFLIIDRGIGTSIETNVKALFKIEYTGKQYRNIQVFEISNYVPIERKSVSDINNKNIKYLITEDSESGRLFLGKLLDKLELYEGMTDKRGKYLGGKDRVPNYIRELSSVDDSYILVALDYDVASTVMLEIMSDTRINMNKIVFISMESFEEILCNSEFILSKFPEMRERVLYYEDYIDASYKHAGKYFSDLLFRYVKAKNPLKQDGERNATKFYEKGMINFEQCFLIDCCSFEGSGCKLYTESDKKKLLLCNKFESLRVFSTAYDNI